MLFLNIAKVHVQGKQAIQRLLRERGELYRREEKRKRNSPH